MAVSMTDRITTHDICPLHDVCMGGIERDITEIKAILREREQVNRTEFHNVKTALGNMKTLIISALIALSLNLAGYIFRMLQ
jgi:hypothetical protein